MRVAITKEEEVIILERFSTEPDECHTWTEQDIYTQKSNILAGKRAKMDIKTTAFSHNQNMIYFNR